MDPKKLYYLILPIDSYDTLKIIINDLNKPLFNCLESNFKTRIVQEILKHPYPTLQILEPFVKQNDSLQKCIVAVMKLFLNENLKNESAFLSFLVNHSLNKINAIAINEDIISILNSANPELSKKIFLNLLARNDLYHIKNIYNNINRRLKGITNKRILFKAISDNEHILAYALNQVNFNEIQNDFIRNNMIIMKILKELHLTNQCIDDIGNLNKFLEPFVLKNASNFHKVIFNDFCRIKMLIEFFKKSSTSLIPIEKVIKKNGIIKTLYDHKNVILIDYEETRQIVEKNYDFIKQIVDDTEMSINNELQILTYFFVLVTIYDIILINNQTDHGKDTYINEKILKLKVMVRQIRDVNILCDLIEDIFKLIFIRYEHLNLSEKNCFNLKKTQTSSDESLNNNQNVKQGFICRMHALTAILNFLKKLITIKLHGDEYKNGNKVIQQRFAKIIDCINDGLQKCAVLKNMQNNENNKVNINSEDLLPIIVPHSDIGEKTSSDDDSKDRSNYASLSRRKAKNKKRNSVSYVDKKRNEKNVNPSVDDRSVILKILYSAEDLALMALAMQNFDDVKNIVQNDIEIHLVFAKNHLLVILKATKKTISVTADGSSSLSDLKKNKAFHLQNTDLEHQLIFVENQEQIKQKLNSIYKKYEEQEMATEKVYSTIEKIKKVAAKGFEASKIISIVENFTINNENEQTEEIRNLIKKYSINYEFLGQYEGNCKRVITTLDLILNSSFNYEITSSICNLIEKPNQQSSLELPTNQSKSKLGSWTFLENLIECLRLLKNDRNKTNFGIQEMLTDNFYSLRPQMLKTELDKEKSFRDIFYKSNNKINDIEDLKTMYKEFDETKSKSSYFNRFMHYIMNLNKLLLIRDRNINLNITEILKFDPKVVIGDLIFHDDMTPLEIEGNVISLNLNLVHLIVLNLCPEFALQTSIATSQRYTIAKEKYNSIFNYITSHNMLLGYLLQKISQIDINMPKSDINEEYLIRQLEFPELKQLSELYDGNHVIATLMSDYCDINRIMNLNDINSAYTILSSFIEMAFNRSYLEAKRNEIIIKIINTSGKYDLLEKITDISLRADLLNKNFNRIHNFTLVNRLIKSVLQHNDFKRVPLSVQLNLAKSLKDIKVYAEVSKVLEHSSWKESYDFSIRSPSIILENLLERNNNQLCLEWCKTVNLSTNYSHSIKIFFNIFLKTLLDIRGDNIDINLLKILETFRPTEICQFYDLHKEKFRCLPLLNYVLEYLEKYEPKLIYKNFKLSLQIFQHLSLDERNANWNFLSKPLLIIEQLIMNCKFKTLSTVLNAIKPSFGQNGNSKYCAYCYDKRGNIYDIYSRHPNKFVLGDEHSSAFILLNFNLYQKDHIVQLECIDLLFRIYATKALDYQINEMYSSSERISQSNDLSSLDSLCGTFIMPKEAPTKEQWVKDEDAVHCMCCKRAVFTMLIRRHHCRRCGRVICFACSTNRLKITNLYDDVPVRACNDCINQTKQIEDKLAANTPFIEKKTIDETCRKADDNKWQLSGNITHDKLLREEFCYEHAPSVALCLSILSYHSNNPWCVNLLLYHCRKLEKLIVPNPEVDYALVARMMNCLAVAAKVRNGPAECDQIRDYSEMIASVVQSGCESLIPSDPLNNRKFGDSLVHVEKWSLALNIFLKCGFPTAGVMAAHGLSCLRAGCFETAREKFTHCLTKVSTETENMTILNIITNENDLDMNKEINIPVIKRPNRGPPLLDEIIKIIESTNFKTPKPETLARASVIRSSNTSLSSTLWKRKDNVPMHEPALNILNSLASLKEITKGNYFDKDMLHSIDNKKHIIRHSRAFEESLYYILTYGSHSDVIHFLMRRKEYSYVLRYFILQNLDPEIFVQSIFLKFLKTGYVNELIDKMLQMDDRLLIWKDTIIYTCRYLETKNLLYSLYQLQILLKDPVRASMTCVKFYSMNCSTFQELEKNSFHLYNAQKHLQTELEFCQWENINIKQKRGQEQQSFLMIMDAKSLNAHINTILRQLEVTKFLAQHEKDCGLLNILRQIRDDSTTIPTLFDSVQEKIAICILILLSGKNIEEGFGLAYRIIEDYKVPSMKVYCGTAKYLSRNNRLEHVIKLINSILSNNGKNHQDMDEILSTAIYSAVNVQETEVKIVCDSLIKKIQSIEIQISCHIFIGQLKAAYLLAIHYNRLNDVRKILRHAEATNQLHIKKLCEKKLNINQRS